MNKILIIGPGAYGLCLSDVLQNNHDNEIFILGNSKEKLEEIQNGEFQLFGKKINPANDVFIDYEKCFLNKYDLIIFTIPSDKLSDVVVNVSKYINYDVNVINTSKGLKNDGEYWCDFFKKINKHFKYSFLTGPSFAEELIRKEKTFCNLCTSKKIFNQINKIFQCDYFRIKHLRKIKIYEFISSMKNAIALCFGIINATTTSQNTISSLFCRLMNELKEIIDKKFKFYKYDLTYYCILGDILMCSFSEQSRNYSYGYDYVKLSSNELETKYKNVTIEGLRTLCFLKIILSKYKLEKNLLSKFVNFIIDNIIDTKELIAYY